MPPFQLLADTLARLSLYTMSSSDDSLLQLLPYAFPSNTPASSSSISLPTLRNSLFLITLDWQKPQTFLEQLRTWIAIIRQTVVAGLEQRNSRQKREQEAFLEEMKDALEVYIRSYTPPTGSSLPSLDAAGLSQVSGDSSLGSSSVPAIVPVSAPSSLGQAGQQVLPLEEGLLNDNLGVGIVVVLTKADTVAKLERDRNFKEEQFDYIQQVLRTICLKYGAALFSTAQSRPTSFAVLRQYLLHRLLSPSLSSSTTTRLPFPHAPATIEKDVLLVPSGWDSWGKIVALRDGFSPASTAQGWDFDSEVEARRRKAKLPKERLEQVEREVRDEYGNDAAGSACRLWEDVIGEWAGSSGSNPTLGKVPSPDPQAFLSQHYSTLQKDNSGTGSSSSSDPRAAFQRTKSQAAVTNGGDGVGSPSDSTSLRSIVGPMQSAGLSGPSVERAMGLALKEDDLDGSPATPSSSKVDTAERPTTTRRESREHRSSASRPDLLATPSSSSRPRSPLATGSSRDSSNSTPGATKQSEVLQSFFQDLLRGKSGGSGGTPARTTSTTTPAKSSRTAAATANSGRSSSPATGGNSVDEGQRRS
jgi:dynein light intermediate chain 1, cytosolic